MAKDWLSPAELAKDSSIYAAWVLVLSGVAAWDVLRTLPFTIQIITGKRRWRWPMALYFADQIFMLIHIFAYAVNLNAISYINCDTVVWMSKITDFLGTCTSTIILALRTTAVWHQDKRVSIPLGVGCLGQIILWTQTMRYSKSIWNPQRKVCQIMATSPVPLLIGVWSYTMTLDFIIMCLCATRLWRSRNNGGIAQVLLRDGIAYFGAAFTSNLIQTILAGLSLNPVMNIIALPFTLVVSVIAATTVFRNVFMMYDDFSGDSGNTSTHASGPTGPIVTFGGTGRSRGFSTSKKTAGNQTYAMGQMRSHTTTLGGIEVTKVVDVERDAGALPYNKDLKIRDDSSSITDQDK